MMPKSHTIPGMQSARPRNPLSGCLLDDDARERGSMLLKYHTPRDLWEAQGLQPLGLGDTIWLTLRA